MITSENINRDINKCAFCKFFLKKIHVGRVLSPGRKLPCAKHNVHKKTWLKKGMVGWDLFNGGKYKTIMHKNF